MEIIVGLIIAVGVVGGALGVLLPRFSAYFLGPIALVFALLVLSVAHKFMFQTVMTDGSPAGLLAPAIAWLAFGSSGLLGGILVIVGAGGVRRAKLRASSAEKMP